MEIRIYPDPQNPHYFYVAKEARVLRPVYVEREDTYMYTMLMDVGAFAKAIGGEFVDVRVMRCGRLMVTVLRKAKNDFYEHVVEVVEPPYRLVAKHVEEG